MSRRAEALARRVELGAGELIAYVETLSDEEWRVVGESDGRAVGVVVHHVASAYLAETDLLKKMASGEGITGVTPAKVNRGNAQHAEQHASASKAEAVALLRTNSAVAANAIRALSDEDLDRASPVSLHSYAPLTTQYYIEEHTIRHSFHHLASIRAVVDPEACAI